MKLNLSADTQPTRRFVLLSPPGIFPRGTFHYVQVDAEWRRELLADMQMLRGRVYLRDGAISERDLTADGRNFQSIDDESWHLLILNSHDRVVGCTRYLQHSPSTTFDRLRVCHAAIACSEKWRYPLRRAVESELEKARISRYSYVEVGGWALDESVRGSGDAVRSVLFTFAWSQVIGGCLGLSMATHRNGSASILRRIGGHPLEYEGQVLPSYYDPRYRCEMEIIRFDSRNPSPKYQATIDAIRSQVPSVTVVSVEEPQRPCCVLGQRQLEVPAGAVTSREYAGQFSIPE